MNTSPTVAAAPEVDHGQQTKLAAQIAAMNAAAATIRAALNWKPDPGKHVRTGVTKNKSQGVSKSRRRMAKLSRRRNRQP